MKHKYIKYITLMSGRRNCNYYNVSYYFQRIIDAFAEMLILSKSQVIVGSQHSSYDEVAAKIGKIKLIKLSE